MQDGQIVHACETSNATHLIKKRAFPLCTRL
jgi:hypothetical protein